MLLLKRLVLFVLAALIGSILPASANNWEGNWNTNFGELRLMQSGDRLFGDYQDRGTIEGRISVDGRSARAVFLYTDGRWGTVQWRIANDKIGGNWNWSKDGLPNPKAQSWTGTRTSARPSTLKYASQARISYPRRDAVFDKGPVQKWLTFSDENNPSPSPSPAPAPNSSGNSGQSTGLWYGGYSLLNTEPAFDISINIIHLLGYRVGAVDMSIFVNRGSQCPQSMHMAFCDELEGLADINGSVKATVTGNNIIFGSLSQAMWITFQLPGDQEDRLLVIGREATYFNASIHHPHRGYDYAGAAKGISHLCEQTHCSKDVFTDIARNPHKYIGAFDKSRANRIYNLPNGIAKSHSAGVEPNPGSNPRPTPNNNGSNQAPRTLMSDAYAILDETSDNLGTISFSGGGNAFRASGTLNGFFETGRPHETEYRLINTTGEAVAFALTTFAGQSGEQRTGQLIIELPSFARNNPKGTLVVGDDIFLIELVRPTSGLEPAEVYDVPPVGVSAPLYALRDVPSGRSIVLRKDANRSSAETGRLSFNARGLTVIRCSPDIDSNRFNNSGRNGKLALLSSSWCQVTNNQIAGWMLGRYLSPQGR